MDIEAPPVTEEGRRKAQLRQAGEAYFEKVLATAGAGGDPFQPQPPPTRSRRMPQLTVDTDLEAVGQLLEGSRLYVLSALFVSGHATSLVLIKASLLSLGTPGILLFLHSLPLVGALAALSSWSGAAYTIGPLTAQSLTGSLTAAAISGLQTLMLFGALRGGSVYLVLAWTVVVPPLMSLQQQQSSNGGVQLPPLLQAGVALAVGGLALLLVFGRWPGLGCLLLLLLWAAAEAGKRLWAELKRRADAGHPLGGIAAAAHVQAIAAAEASVEPSTAAFLEAALPAVPALLLGFIFLEGRELVDHDLSVPAVSTILLSMLFWAAGRAAGVVLAETAQPRLLLHLSSLAAATTILVEIGVHGFGRIAALLGALAALAGAALFRYSPQG